VRWKFAAEITENINKKKIKDVLLRGREKTKNYLKCKWISGEGGKELKEVKISQIV
jgi:hypothetical protein